MSESERRDFLLALPARTGKLAVTRKDGRPYVAPVWFDLDEDEIVFTTGEGTVKGKAIRRDGRVCLCVDDEAPPFSYVMIEGEASVVDDAEALLRFATRIGGRYMASDQAEAFGRRNAVEGELLIRVRPTRVVAKAGVAEWPATGA
jgi:PPOX class probable F420-dependent enzyme